MAYVLAATILLTAGGCIEGSLYNNITSLGGTTPFSRGSVRVSFVNATDYRAIFTYGIYDRQDQTYLFDTDQQPRQIGQFVVNPASGSRIQDRLEGNTSTEPITLQCGRTLALGTAELIQVIKDSNLTVDLDEDALRPGIAFSDRQVNEDGAADATAGEISGGFTVLQGYEFQCEALVILTLREDSANPKHFYVEVQVIGPEPSS